MCLCVCLCVCRNSCDPVFVAEFKKDPAIFEDNGQEDFGPEYRSFYLSRVPYCEEEDIFKNGFIWEGDVFCPCTARWAKGFPQMKPQYVLFKQQQNPNFDPQFWIDKLTSAVAEPAIYESFVIEACDAFKFRVSPSGVQQIIQWCTTNYGVEAEYVFEDLSRIVLEFGVPINTVVGKSYMKAQYWDDIPQWSLDMDAHIQVPQEAAPLPPLPQLPLPPEPQLPLAPQEAAPLAPRETVLYGEAAEREFKDDNPDNAMDETPGAGAGAGTELVQQTKVSNHSSKRRKIKKDKRESMRVSSLLFSSLLFYRALLPCLQHQTTKQTSNKAVCIVCFFCFFFIIQLMTLIHQMN